MKVLFVFGIILAYISCHSEAYVGVSVFSEDPAHPGKCLGAAFPETKETYHDIGSTWVTNKCERHSCGRVDERRLEISVTGCSVAAYPSECIPVPINYSKPFPECCPTARCP